MAEFPENIVHDYRELQAGTIAVQHSNSLIALAGKRQVAILSTPTTTQSKCQRAHPKFDAHGACWARHEATLAVTCAQSLEFYAVCSDAIALSLTLKAHARNITDVDWCWHAPLLVSCALDEPVAVWDAREGLSTSSRATILLPAIAGASQARWAPLSEHILATAHDGGVKIWDIRRPNAPQQYLSAHVAKVHSLEWSSTNENMLATAAVDGIKFWRLDATQKHADSATRTAAWKIRFSPCGGGLAAIALPGSSSADTVLLYRRGDGAPAHQLTGHTDAISDLSWMPSAADSELMHLLTIAKDNTLRAWAVSRALLATDVASVVHTTESSPVLTQPATPVTPAAVESAKPTTLQLWQQDSVTIQRIRDVADAVGVTVESIENGAAVIGCVVSNETLRVSINLRGDVGGMQAVQLISVGTTVHPQARTALLKALRATWRDTSAEEKPIECCRQLPSLCKAILMECTREQPSPMHYAAPTTTSRIPGRLDNMVPFPRTCGACFTPAGDLIVFKRPTTRFDATRRFRREESRPKEHRTTPRSYAALADDRARIYKLSAFYYRHGPERRPKNTVEMYNMSAVLRYDRRLGARYIINPRHQVQMCKHNADAAAQLGNVNAARMWRCLGAILAVPENIRRPLDADLPRPLAMYKIGREMVESIIKHCLKWNDVQMLAMIACTFNDEFRHSPPDSLSAYTTLSRHSDSSNVPDKEALNTRHASAFALTIPRSEAESDSASFAYSPPEYALYRDAAQDMLANDSDTLQAQHDANCRLISLPLHPLLELAKYRYAEMLLASRLFIQATEVLKCGKSRVVQQRGPKLLALCLQCYSTPPCSHCNEAPVLSCSVCRRPVRGLVLCCFACGHGGHILHYNSWFRDNTTCPSGCGCTCFQYQTPKYRSTSPVSDLSASASTPTGGREL